MKDVPMEKFLNALNWAGYISTLIVAATVLWRFYLWLRGISPALRSLGNGLSKRKIALFAKNENSASLKDALLRSNLFSEQNIFAIQQPVDIGSAEDASVFVVYWPDWASDVDEILRRKSDRTPLIVYSPRTADQISAEDMIKIDGHRNTAISNFRGRLLNDIVSAMITTSYEK